VAPGEEREGQGAEAPPRERQGFSTLLGQLASADPVADGGWARGPRAGDVVGRFELLRELGRGGFGVVYEARDRELGRLVAFKAIRPGSRARSAQRAEWLRREAEATAQLAHENIVALHDAGRAESGPYLVFELLEGETLGERLERGPLPPREAVAIAGAIARALSYAHSSGVLHRDLKPSNVFLTSRGQVKVLDFGLAHVFGWSASRSGGTAPYMAPEQWRGEPEDGRTDVFAAGVLLHEMLTGRLPYELRDGRSSALDPQAPAPALEGVPPSLRQVLSSALAPSPDDRPRSAEVLLERLLEADRALAGPTRPRWPPRRSVILGAVAALAAIAMAAVWRLSTAGRGTAARGATAAAPESVDAYRHYFAALKAMDAIRYDEAQAELSRALDIDPEFALALYLRAYLGEFTGDPVAVQRANAESAARFASRLPEKEQLLVRAWAAHARGDDAEARRIHRTAVERYPTDAEVLYFAGDLLFHAGDMKSSIPLFERALQARPGWGAPLAHLLEALEALDRRADAIATARRAVAALPNSETYTALGKALIREDPEQALRALRSAVVAGGGPGAIQQLSDGLLFAGRLDEAEAEGRTLLAPEISPEWQLEGYHQLFKVRALQGRYRELLRLLDEIPAAVRASNLAHHHEAATVVLVNARGDPARRWLEARSWGNPLAAFALAYAGDLPHAAELARGLSPGPMHDHYEGLVLWRRGERISALRPLQAAAAAWPGKIGLRIVMFHLATVFGELGRDREALEAVRRFLDGDVMEIPNAFAIPRAWLLSARSLERLGRRDEALREVDRLLALWKAADADLPELAEARAIRARLVAAGAPAGR
jgi:tetratricopeptide (TPR) repeat protein